MFLFEISGENIFAENETIVIFQIIIVSPSLIILYSLLGCQFGLAYDIMSSGNEFAEFRGAFEYLSRYWWQYFLLSLLSGFYSFFYFYFFDEGENPLTVWYGIIITLLGMVYYYSLLMTMPSITAQGSIRRAFSENKQIIKKDPRRYWKTWLIFLMLFYIPNYVMVGLMLSSPNEWMLILISLFAMFYSFFIMYPMMVLIATRIYNTTDIPKPYLHEEDDIFMEKAF